MERISDDRLDDMIEVSKMWTGNYAIDNTSALVELRERRAAENAPCPEHAKIIAEWDTYEMGRDDSSAAPFWCQLYKDGMLQGQGIGMTMEDAIRQADAATGRENH